MEKPIKVMWNGKPLRNIYPHATRFQVFKFKLKRLFRKVLIVSFVAGLVFGAFKMGVVTTEPVFVQAQDKSAALFASKIDKLKNEVVAKVQACESKGHKESDGIIIFDSNSKASIGTLQFQKATVIHYYKVLYGKTITPKEAVLIALDDEKAESLAKDIMFTTKNKAVDWFNCSKAHNIGAQIDIIKSLEK